VIDLVEGASGTLEGTLGEIRFRDARSGRLVATLIALDGRPIPVVGTLADAEEGDALRLSGKVVRNPKYGLQFEIGALVDPEVDAASAQAYLGSGLVHYIGPSTARAIVEALGADAIRRLLKEPERLADFRGMNEARIRRARRDLRATAHLAPLVGLLAGFGISRTATKRIHKRYGSQAIDLIRANPWRLAADIHGIGFKSADRVATGLGVPPDAPQRLEAACIQALKDLAAERGHTIVDAELVVTWADKYVRAGTPLLHAALERLVATGELETGERIDAEGVRRHGYALPRLAGAERLIAAKVRMLSSFADATPLVVSDEEIDELETSEGIAFDDSQRRAIKGALEEHVTVLTGNPGTGKTTIVRAILDIAERRGLSIALASPTGRAAKRLAEATGRPASTIHRWLRYHPFEGFKGPESLPELLVVDEASMLDITLAARVFSALPPFGRLLLVGDEDQLPAIGPGNVLADLIRSPRVAVFRLRRIHRQAAGSGVPELAAAIRDGNTRPPYDGKTTVFVPADGAEAAQRWIVEAFAKRKLDADRIQVLTPMNIGPAGTESLNRFLQELANPPGPDKREITIGRETFREGDRILVTGNDYRHELYNGDILRLRRIDEEASELTVTLDGRELVIPATNGISLSLAYAMTVHKAQGSEFDVVVVPVVNTLLGDPERGQRRSLLYTAISRARDVVVVVGQEWAVAASVNNHNPDTRSTQLRTLLGETVESVAATPLPADDEEWF
jgi:exodeoxyribonuclease V alpha subunit